MTPARARARLAALPGALLALALAAGATAPAGAAPAEPRSGTAPTAVAPRAQAADAGIVPVRLDGIEPVVPAPGGTLVLVGTVTNEAATEITGAAVRLRLSPTPVRSRGELDAILAGTAGRTGIAVAGTRTVVAERLAPGASAPFRITIPIDDLGLPQDADQVVVLAVESLGDVADDGQGEVQTGLARTFLPWFPDRGSVVPTPVVWLYPLSSAPSRLADGVFLDDHLAVEVGPEGRLTRLLDAAGSVPAAVSWVVDPALLQSLEDMADGYDVRTGAVRTKGTGGEAARAWLDRLTAYVGGADVTVMAYGVPDVVALHRSGLDVDIALASTTERDLPERVLGRPVAHGLAWPPGQASDDGTLVVLRASGSTAVVLGADSFPPSQRLDYTPSGSVDVGSGGSPLRAVLSDPAVSPLVAAPAKAAVAAGTAATPAQQRQLALAEIAMTTLERPRTPRSLVIAPSVGWSAYGGATADVLDAVAASPFAEPQRLADLLAAPASDVPRERADYPAAAKAAELRPAYLALVGRQRAALAGLRSVAPDTAEAGDGAATTGDLEEALTRCESSWWRSDAATARRLLGQTTAAIEAQVSSVRVLSRAHVTLPGDEGTIPVTIANDLDRPARVGVRLTGAQAARFAADEVAPVTLQPGQKQTVEVTARVVGTGAVDVTIELLTPEGDTFGRPVETQVRSAAYARAAQWVVGGLFGILVVLLGANVVRRRRSSGGAA